MKKGLQKCICTKHKNIKKKIGRYLLKQHADCGLGKTNGVKIGRSDWQKYEDHRKKTKAIFHMAQCCAIKGNMAESSTKRQEKVTLNVGKGWQINENRK